MEEVCNYNHHNRNNVWHNNSGNYSGNYHPGNNSCHHLCLYYSK